MGWSGGSYQSAIAYTYDAGNRLTRAADSSTGTITFQYDDLDRLIGAATPQGSVAYTYDNDGRRTSLTVLGQPAIRYAYDAAERLVTITQGATTVSLVYDAANRRTSTVLPNGIVGSYDFDAANQLTSIRYALGSNLLGDLTYAIRCRRQSTRHGRELGARQSAGGTGRCRLRCRERIDAMGFAAFHI